MNDKQNLVAVWIDNRENNDDVYGQVFSELGVRSGENYKINDDIGSASQREPKPDIAANGDMMIVWEDERNGFSNYIYGQFYTGNGQPADTNIQISEKTGYDPAISMNSQGESIIVWDDYSGITAQRFTSSRQRFFSNFQITANKRGEYYNSDPQAAIDDENNFIVIWKKRLEAEQETDIYGQRYNQYGQPIGNQFVVNDTSNSLPYNSYRFQIAIETGKNGNFCVFWLNSIDNKYHIIGQRFSDNGTPDGNNFIVDDNESSLYSPSIRTGIDEEGNVIITWDDHRNGSFDIYAQRYAKDGHPIGSNFKVNDDNGFAGQSSPSIAVAPNGSFVISWIDYRFEFNQPYIIGQRYGANGEPVGSNYIIVDGSQWHSQLYPAVAANSNQIVFTWQDNRRLKGWDIYAKIAGWDWDGFTSVEREKKIPQQYALGNNYPNPFNPITTIAYDLPKVSNVKIEVFNMLGQKVALVIDKKQPAGCYKIQFDAGFLASGLYYYRIEADEFIQTKKMVLLK
ncbi:MAG: T9SS type A sorting domain-containing protein [Actinobacteria bacterium]|nr:T9SS type A sorting domain-containing protein [Actinomycetota bacterium]